MSVTRRTALQAGLAVAAISTLPRIAHAASRYTVGDRDCLLVIDVQKCFTSGGTLEVPKGDEVVPLINKLAKGFRNVVVTQDWHTTGHASFASTYPGKKPFDSQKLPYGQQVLWPDHCVQGTEDAALHKDLSIPHAQLVLRKGYNRGVDSYSAFLEADRKTDTGLAGYLKARNIDRVFVAGLATDFCVAWTALDARKKRFKAVVIEDACRGIDANGSLKAAWAAMAKAGVVRAQSADLPASA